MSVILSKSISVGGLFQEKTIISPAATTIISSIPLLGVVGVKFWITLIDVTNTKVHLSEINLVINGAVTKHSRFGHVGEKININLDVNIVGGNIELSAINNETVTINSTVISETIYT